METVGLVVIMLLTGYAVCRLTLQVWDWLSSDHRANRSN